MKKEIFGLLTATIALSVIFPIAAQACGDKENQTTTTSEPVKVETTSS
ncbi:MAG: hypothetical protein ACFBSE_08690 [Prochloraceae cyanobacterium]